MYVTVKCNIYPKQERELWNLLRFICRAAASNTPLLSNPLLVVVVVDLASCVCALVCLSCQRCMCCVCVFCVCIRAVAILLCWTRCHVVHLAGKRAYNFQDNFLAYTSARVCLCVCH